MFVRLTLFIALSLPPAFAGTETLSLAQTADIVRHSNPALRAARVVVDEARGRQLGAGRLANPSISLDAQNESRVSPSLFGVSLDQSFPITKRLSLEKRWSAQLLQAAELEVLEVERRLIAEAQALVVQGIILEQKVVLLKKQIALAQELSTFTKQRSEKGELSPLDTAQAQIDAQRALLESRRLETERVRIYGDLRTLLGRQPTATLVISGDLPMMRLPALRTWESRADFQSAKLAEYAAQTEIELAKSKQWQDVNAGVFTAAERQQGVDTGFVGFRLSLPLPLWNRNQGEVAEKTAKAQRATLESDALATAIANEASTARAEMSAHAKLARETKDSLLPLLLEQSDRLEKAYQSGQIDLMTLLRARDQRLHMEAALLDANRDFHLARIRYEAATGQHAPASSH